MMNLVTHIRAFSPRLLMAGLAIAVCLIASAPNAAYAGCAPGVPCITNATPNDPVDTNDGPNNGGPNRNKVSTGNCSGATPGAGCACDADLMNQIYSRAYLEAQRDTIKAEILIRKPDSVMEYSCFDQMLNRTVDEAAPLFSETTDWMFRVVDITSAFGIGEIAENYIPFVFISDYMGPNKMQTSIENLVKNSLEDYIDDNFDHKFLGGAANSLDYAASGGSYNCTYMNRVYFLSKCTDIVNDDRFWKFSELINPDPRVLPQQCPNPNTQITQQKIDLAENRNFQYVNFDRVTSYNAILAPGAPCRAPIPTGITVINHTRSIDALGNVTITNTNSFPDKVCPNPNCYYTGTTCTP
jgi:hypothetical protein